MKRMTLFIVTLMLSLSLALAASAQKPPLKQKFYKMENMELIGKKRGPSGKMFMARRQAKFGKLNRIPPKSFFPAMFQSAKELTR